ncbi:MAG: hypothetical protein FJ245_02205 [Nitrospira sp.]|nr:hypothetical protein [Nitrospira sp.]
MKEERQVNYYSVLEIAPTATDADIKKAWHEQIQVWHPDRFSHSPALHKKAETRTQLINQAYQTLSDPASRARYDATTPPAPAPQPPQRPAQHTSAQTTPPPRPQPAQRSRQGPRGPQAAVTLSREGHPVVMVPACNLLVDCKENLPYTFEGFSRIAGTSRRTLPAGDYVIEEAPDIFCVLRKRVEEVMTAFSNPSGNRQRFLAELNPLRSYPHRFLVIEGTLQHNKSGGLLGQYQKNGLMDFLDAITARYGIQIIYTDSREEAEERVANLAAMHYAYYFAEQQKLGRCLKEDDL